MVTIIKKDGLYRCSGCGYIHLLETERTCPRCKEEIDWSSVAAEKALMAPIRRRKEQMILLVSTFTAVSATMALFPFSMWGTIMIAIALLSGTAYLIIGKSR
jgi:hypothetical protein